MLRTCLVLSELIWSLASAPLEAPLMESSRWLSAVASGMALMRPPCHLLVASVTAVRLPLTHLRSWEMVCASRRKMEGAAETATALMRRDLIKEGIVIDVGES